MREVEVLGPIRIGGTPVTSPTQSILLAVLAAAAPAPVPFHRLVDAVWEDPPPTAENSLHSHLSRLRSSLGPGGLVREGDAYVLRSPTDIARFVAAVEAAGPTGPERRDELAAARSAWRGTPFGSCADHRFVRPATAALTVQYCRAVRESASLELADGRPLAAVAELRELVADHPLDEEGWALLVEALDAGGRRAEALRAVQEAIAALGEVGLEPGPALREAEAAAVRGAAPIGGTRLPLADGPFVGRGELVDELAGRIVEPGWTTLIGPGGVGKTRLATELAAGMPSEAVFADLSDAEAGDLDVVVARAVGAPLRPPYRERVVSRLSGESLVLVLDCCELVADAVGALGADLLERCRRLHVIATSRTPLRVPGEHLVEITPLGAADAAALVRLCSARMGVAAPDDEVIDELCDAVDRLPLQIELVAGALRHMSPDELLDALDDPVGSMAGGDRLVAGVRRSMAGLAAGDRAMLARLSLLRSPFVIETASDLAEQDRAVDRLRTLRDRSLLSPADTAAGRRLRMLDTIRAVARLDLDGAALDAATARHAAVFATRAEQIAVGLRTADELRWLDVAETELADLRAAHSGALERGDADAAMAIPAAMFHLVYDRLRADLASWADESLDAVGTDHPLAPLVLAVSALGAMHADDHDRAREQVERARERAAGTARHAELVQANLGLRSGDLARSHAAAEAVVAASLAVDDVYTATVGHVLRVLTSWYGGDRAAALGAVADARRTSRAVGAPTLLAYADYAEGEVRAEDEPEVALELLRRAHDRALANRSALAEGVSLVTITTIRARSDDPAGALADFGAAIDHWRRRGDWNRQWSTLRNFTELLARTGRDELAAVLIGAIDAHGGPTFGAEAIRFHEARHAVAQRLGRATDRLLARGRSLTGEELLEYALDATH